MERTSVEIGLLEAISHLEPALQKQIIADRGKTLEAIANAPDTTRYRWESWRDWLADNYGN